MISAHSGEKWSLWLFAQSAATTHQVTNSPIICIILSCRNLAFFSCQLTFEMFSANRMFLTIIVYNWPTNSLTLWISGKRKEGQMKELPYISKAIVRVRKTTDHKRHHRSLLAKISDWREEHILLPETTLNKLHQVAEKYHIVYNNLMT